MQLMNHIIPLLVFLIQYYISAPLKINTKTRQIIDDQGRERFFHGINVIMKQSPWLPETRFFDIDTSFNEDDMRNLEDWGFNIIRLGTQWQGAEPTRGQYNMTYFNELKAIVEKSKSFNIYTLLDFHQDVLAPEFCGEGLPKWAVKVPNSTYKFPIPLQFSPFQVDSEGIPLKSECNKIEWTHLHFTYAIGKAYQALYKNVDNIADSFALFWRTVANMFKNEDYVIGYELMNEPWAGDVLGNPLLLIPSVADKWNLEPFYDRVQKKIREVDDEHIIFFESVTFDDFIPVGFSSVPGGDNYKNRSVLSYHYYSNINLNLNLHMWSRNRDIVRLGGGGMVTEFGIGNTEEEVTKFMNVSDNYLQSWIGWSYKHFAGITGDGGRDFYNDDNSIKWERVKIVSRSYPQAVAGETKRISFDPVNKTLELEYISCKCGETEIYFNQYLHYSDGFIVEISPIYGATWRIIRKNLIGIKSATMMNGEIIKVVLRKK